MNSIYKEALCNPKYNRKEVEYLYQYLKKESLPNKKDLFLEYLKKLEQHLPVQYIIGNVDFYGNRIFVNKNVLIPRFCTEELVYYTSKYIEKYFINSNIHILDLCTGSGCIAIALKRLFPYSTMVASDISPSALLLAKENASYNQTDISFIQSNLLENISGKFDVVISNPPYIALEEEIDPKVKNNEPHLALYAPNHGLFFYEEILKQLSMYLKEKYFIAFEIGYQQRSFLYDLAKQYFQDATIFYKKDLEGFDRFIFITNFE